MAPLPASTRLNSPLCPHSHSLSLHSGLLSFIPRRIPSTTQHYNLTPKALFHPHQDPDSCIGMSAKEGRRKAMLKMTIASSSALLLLSDAVLPSISPAYADTEDMRTYSDDTNKYKIVLPNDWQVGSGETDGIRSLTAFYPQQSSNSNVSVLITGLGPDFTRLESFGNVDAFAETLVSGLDRSWQRPAGVSAKLIDCKSSKGLYYIEYTLQNPGESVRHIYSALGVQNTGWYNRLYTVTGQFFEEEADKYGSKVENAVKSFRFLSS